MEMEEPAERLISFWSQVDPADGVQVHRDDRSIFDTLTASIRDHMPSTPKDWMLGARAGKIELGLVPAPYCGDIRNAKVFICMLNPGLADVDFYAEQKQDYRARLARQLRQEGLERDEFPFLHLDPTYCWTGGYRWWISKLDGIIKYFAEKRNMDYFQSSRWLSTKVASLELFPYHSKNFRSHRLLKTLPSVKIMLEFAQTLAARGDCLIVSRQVGSWGLSGRGVLTYDAKHARGASLSPISKGGKKVIEVLSASQ